MADRDSLGSFEQLVLAALVRLGADGYGMSVREEIEERTGRDLAIGAVYATLDRMETKGYVRSRIGESTAERGGKARRYYKMLPKGEAVLRDALRQLNSMVAGLNLGWNS